MADPMNMNSSLARLRDIHLPDPISWWPLAPGWYVLATIIALLLVLGGWKFYQWWRWQQPKRIALKMLTQYEKMAEAQNNTAFICARISELLRRVALVYYPREQVAGLSGEDWLEFLNQTSKTTSFSPVRELLLEAPFGNQQPQTLTPLFNRAKEWIKQRRKPCLS